MRPASPPEKVNLVSHITMEVDNEYNWLMEEASFKLVEGPLPVSKRQQRKGLGPTVYILSFNSIEALEKKKNLLGTITKSFLNRPCPSLREGGGAKQNHGGPTCDEEQTLGPSLKYRVASPSRDICRIPMETSARTLGKSPRNRRTTDSRRPTAVTDWETAPSTWSNQPEKGAMV